MRILITGSLNFDDHDDVLDGLRNALEVYGTPVTVVHDSDDGVGMVIRRAISKWGAAGLVDELDVDGAVDGWAFKAIDEVWAYLMEGYDNRWALRIVEMAVAQGIPAMVSRDFSG